jgi:hypothetical protein
MQPVREISVKSDDGPAYAREATESFGAGLPACRGSSGVLLLRMAGARLFAWEAGGRVVGVGHLHESATRVSRRYR